VDPMLLAKVELAVILEANVNFNVVDKRFGDSSDEHGVQQLLCGVVGHTDRASKPILIDLSSDGSRSPGDGVPTGSLTLYGTKGQCTKYRSR